MGKIPLEICWLPRPATKYPGCYPLGFEQMLPTILQTTNYVHLFSGKAKTGYRIDIKSELQPDLVANIENLNMINDATFDGAMADPPYKKDGGGDFSMELYKVPYPKWSIWTKEMVRIVKPGSLIAVMENYILPRITDCDYVKILCILTRVKQYPKIVTIQRRRK